MTKLLMLIFQSSFIKPSLEICLVTTKEGIVTHRVAGLAFPGCKGLSTMVRSPTYAVLSRNQFSRVLRAHGRGGSQKVTSDDEGEGVGVEQNFVLWQELPGFFCFQHSRHLTYLAEPFAIIPEYLT